MNFLRRNSLEKNKTKQATDVSKRPDEAVQESGESIILFHWLPVSLGRLAQLELSVLQINQIKKDNSSETSSHTFFFFFKTGPGITSWNFDFQNFQPTELKKQTTESSSPPKTSSGWFRNMVLWLLPLFQSQKASRERLLCFLHCDPPTIMCGCGNKELWILFLQPSLS